MSKSEQLLQWYKAHKARLVSEFLVGVRNNNQHPILVMMAGYPGSGKSEYIKNSSELSLLPVIDLDDLVALFPDYQPKYYYDYRQAGGRLLSALFDRAIKQKISFILEGTFSSEISLQNIERALRRGYQVTIIRMLTDAKKSWGYAESRRLLTGRPTEKSGFDTSVRKVDDNYQTAKANYSHNKNVIFKEIAND